MWDSQKGRVSEGWVSLFSWTLIPTKALQSLFSKYVVRSWNNMWVWWHTPVILALTTEDRCHKVKEWVLLQRVLYRGERTMSPKSVSGCSWCGPAQMLRFSPHYLQQHTDLYVWRYGQKSKSPSSIPRDSPSVMPVVSSREQKRLDLRHMEHRVWEKHSKQTS